jgi:hypothetical protein
LTSETRLCSRLAKQGCAFLPRALHDSLQVREKLRVYRIVACFESLNRLLTAADQDREQRDFLLVRVRFDPRFLPRYAAVETIRALASAKLRRASITRSA